MKKPFIGVMPLYDEEKDSLWMIPGYMDGIREAGGIPIMFPLTDNEDEIYNLISICDGLLFTGGQDVSTDIYGEEQLDSSVVPCPKRDEMEKIVLSFSLKQDVPVLGICRGIQFINAYLGGTLFQDLYQQHKSDINHSMTPPYDRVVHKVRLEKNTPLYNLLDKEIIGVNSYHHQAIKLLSDVVRPMAFSEDELCEAFYMPSKRFVWALQWHPELSYKSDENSRAIFKAFVIACSSRL